MNSLDRIFDAVESEMQRQDERFGVRNQHPLKWGSILTEEVGEINKAINDADFDVERLDQDNYKTELIQTMAVCAQALLNLPKYYEAEKVEAPKPRKLLSTGIRIQMRKSEFDGVVDDFRAKRALNERLSDDLLYRGITTVKDIKPVDFWFDNPSRTYNSIYDVRYYENDTN